ncbi:hypothetical protein EON80_21620, partial [bacterium]
MKKTLPLFLSLAIAPLAHAAPVTPPIPNAAPTSSMTPAAKALLDRATVTYKNAKGLHFRTLNTVGGEEDISTRIDFSGPKKVIAEAHFGNNTFRSILNNDEFHTVINDSTYSKGNTPTGSGTELLTGLGSDSSQLIASMLEGKNPVEDMLSQYATFPYLGLKSKTVALAPRPLDGAVLNGVRLDFNCSLKSKDGGIQPFRKQLTLWFGGSPLALRRLQRWESMGGQTVIVTEKVFEQNFNPTFADDTFNFKEAGLKTALQDEAGNEVYWDPRLKVGTKPFPFEAKGLDGKPVSLAN